MDTKVGDIVHVRAVVKGLDSGDLGVQILLHSGLVWVTLTEIVHTEPPPIKVGDIVSHKSRKWRILARDGECFWIKDDSGGYAEFASVHRICLSSPQSGL